MKKLSIGERSLDAILRDSSGKILQLGVLRGRAERATIRSIKRVGAKQVGKEDSLFGPRCVELIIDCKNLKP